MQKQKCLLLMVGMGLKMCTYDEMNAGFKVYELVCRKPHINIFPTKLFIK